MLNFPFHRGWRIAVIAGIPVYLEFSCLIVLFLWTLTLSEKFAYVLPGSGWGMGFLVALLMYSCVFLHELGHAFAGRHYGMRVNSIVIHGMGGVAYLLGTHRTPRQLLEVSIAGPLVNLVLFAILSLVLSGFKETVGWFPLMVEQIKNFNLILVLFNLLPIPPLDGRQVLRAVQWRWAGRFLESNRSLSILGYGVGITAIAIGIFLFIHSSFTGIWLIFLGIWVCSMNKIEASQSQTSPSRTKNPPQTPQNTTQQVQPPNQERSITLWSYLEAPPLEIEEAVFQTAMNSLKATRGQEAIAAFTDALQSRPSSAQGFYNRGIVYLRVGQLQEALADFKTALRLNPELSEAHLGKGNVYAELNDLESAIESYNRRLEASPDDATTIFNRATAYAELGNTSAAISDYKRARDLFSGQGDITIAQKVLGRLQRLNELDKPQDYTPVKTKSAGSNDAPDPLVRDKLLRLLKQDRAMAERLIALAKKNDPNRSESWYWEKVLWDVERDRFR